MSKICSKCGEDIENAMLPEGQPEMCATCSPDVDTEEEEGMAPEDMPGEEGEE